MHPGIGLLTDRQKTRLQTLVAGDDHVEVEATWSVYQRMIAAYREPDPVQGRALMQAVIAAITSSVPKALGEVTTLGRTLKKCAADVLAYFDCRGTSNGPAEAINGRLEHLRGSALGFPAPDPLHRSLPARGRRVQTPTTHRIVKSPITYTHGHW